MTVVGEKYLGTETFDRVYRRLIQIARKKETITYGEIAEMMPNIPKRGNYMSREVGQISGEISQYEYLHGRPLLSAVVIRGDKKTPGEGFFNMARELSKLQEDMDKRSFWERELEEVYKTWS